MNMYHYRIITISRTHDLSKNINSRPPPRLRTASPEQPNNLSGGARADRRRRRPLPRGYAVPGGDERGGGAVPGWADGGDLAHAGGGRGGRLDGGGIPPPGRRRPVQVHPETLISLLVIFCCSFVMDFFFFLEGQVWRYERPELVAGSRLWPSFFVLIFAFSSRVPDVGSA